LIEFITDYQEIEKYKSFLPVVATKEYLSYNSSKYGWFLSDKFILPFYLSKKLIFTRIFFTTSLIPLSETSPNDEKIFLNEVVDSAKKNKIDIIELPASNAIFNFFPKNAPHTEFGTFIVDLSLDEEILFKNLHQKHRNVVRKAEKDGVVITFCDEKIKECYDIIKDTYARQGKSFIIYEKFLKLKENLGDNVRFYLAIKNNVIQSVAVLLWNENHSSYYLYGGSIKDPYTGSNNLLHWRAMIDMKALGVKLYDFMGARIEPEAGSKLEGIQRFKERFGGNLKTGFIWKYPVNNTKYFFFEVITRLYYLSKFRRYDGDIISQERRRKKMYRFEVNDNIIE
jgi:Acetyltransferase (GNAT) domain